MLRPNEKERYEPATPRLISLVAAGVLTAMSSYAEETPVHAVAQAPAREAEPREWRHLTMDDITVDLDLFQPIRVRYLQVIYDLEGRQEAQSKTIVHIDLDRAVHSGRWNGQVPVVIEPLREPGLLIVWQIQNALYSGFDRVLTDQHLSLKERVMPGGRGLLIGMMEGRDHIRIHATPREPGTTLPIGRTTLAGGAINVLTMPYALAAMDLRVGDRFTLPGYALIGGPDSTGIAWRGAFQVVSARTHTVKGQTLRFAEVLFNRMDENNGLTTDQIDRTEPGHRTTRLLISSDPPYLLGRANLMMGEDGNEVFIREFLGLVDWADQPLPSSDFAGAQMWNLDLDKGSMTLRRDATPAIEVPLKTP